MFEIEHIPFDEGLPDLFVGPGDEHLVVVVRLLGQAHAEVNGNPQVHPLPVCFEQNAKLLKEYGHLTNKTCIIKIPSIGLDCLSLQSHLAKYLSKAGAYSNRDSYWTPLSVCFLTLVLKYRTMMTETDSNP
jgi:hypothetical protein